ncbi:hypothetical protein FPD46_05045 [Campylobacter peloridis]|uniref:Uncharacterized protein n=1 Tax=Campylobacter peloridis TaxID=488546 RepID=A0A5C7DPC1_9BACT|nr:hypothetical protein [Campylobacter peloridis]TXE81658.1 hypothetical protein FPD46_05045 [Campylobacter peloridis]
MEKLTYFLKNIFEILENYLLGLSQREYRLILLLSFIFGIFIVYISVYDNLETQKYILKENLNSLQEKYKQNKEEIAEYNQDFDHDEFNAQDIFSVLNKDYQEVLSDIEKKLNHTQVKNLQIQTNKYKDKNFAFYELKLNYISSFSSLMEFLNQLDDNVKVRKLDITKNENDLKISIILIFVLI